MAIRSCALLFKFQQLGRQPRRWFKSTQTMAMAYIHIAVTVVIFVECTIIRTIQRVFGALANWDPQLPLYATFITATRA
ncbi:uncharacterized protein BT62DRAFT_1013603 [Guyanagaster necrorhizus]|uniref:Uncharacterized protein n=1 Tax=Guyanagaster necrorhizus TaxID=856835 RepID=A0A9P7VFR0_9AGAR|nr:uncharacterized protein BT62DRAFT_1013603 [Guyanagaster necrorhizus MCA 3950]KAG7439720.1 hypothetical protein BT62DRAFT_1013603 [Guyanagaster necrorhizus MCA 3950]